MSGFKWRHFQGEVILRAVRWYCRYGISYRDLEQMMGERKGTLGHADGDVILAAVGQRLLSSISEADTVGRMGGDEFVIVMSKFLCIEDVERFGNQIVRNASHPIEISGQMVNLTLSVGVSVFPENGRTVEYLLRNADAAMYAVKDSGRIASVCSIRTCRQIVIL